MSARLLVACAAWVLVAAGCAKTDWIAGTLVTVDVSGVWQGGLARGNAVGGQVEMTLVQDGPRVTGQALLLGTKISLEGTVRGDVFTFRDPSGRLHGQATVAGDAMTGDGWTNISVTSAQQGRFRLNLSRQP